MKYSTLHLTEAAFNLIKAKHAKPGFALTQDDGIVHLMPYIPNMNNEVIEPIDPDEPDGPGSNIDEPVIDLPDDSNMEFVDLELPSGTLWAKWNLGANSSVGYGNYYAWGEQMPRTISNNLIVSPSCDWDHYEFYENGQFTKYNDIDGKINLTLEGDDIVANQYSDYSYRMPTKDDFQELIDNTENDWIENYNNSGINGWIFRSNEQELFLPAAGIGRENTLNSLNNEGVYLSSTLGNNGYNLSYALLFNLGIDIPHLNKGYRYLVCSIRPVYKP